MKWIEEKRMRKRLPDICIGSLFCRLHRKILGSCLSWLHFEPEIVIVQAIFCEKDYKMKFIWYTDFNLTDEYQISSLRKRGKESGKGVRS